MEVRTRGKVKNILYKVLMSLVFGIAGFYVNLYPISLDVAGLKLDVFLGFIFPMLIAFSWGPLYALIACVLGFGTQTGWFLWYADSGYAAVLAVALLTAWLIWHSLFFRQYRKFTLFKNPYILEVPFRVFYLAALYFLWNYAHQLNPSPGAPDSLTVAGSLSLIQKAVADTVTAFLVLFFSHILFRLSGMRKILKLERTAYENITGYILVYSLFLAILLLFAERSMFYFLESTGEVGLGKDFLENNFIFYVNGFMFLIISLTGGFLVSARARKINRAESKILDLVKRSPLPAFAIDKNCKIVYWNSAMSGLCGFDEQDMIGRKDYWRLFYGKKKPLPADLLIEEKNKEEIECVCRGTVKDVGRQGGYLLVEDFFPGLGSNGKWLLMGAFLIRDRRNRPDSAIQVFQDITGYKERENNLLIDIKRVEDYLKGIQNIFFTANPEGRILHFNEEALKVLGYQQQQFKELNLFKDLLRGTGPGYIQKLIKDFNSAKESVSAELEIAGSNKDGHLVRWKITFRKDGAGNLQEFVFTGFDVTLLRKKEAENCILLDFFDKAPDPFLRVSRDGIVIYHNEASQPCLKVWGYQTSLPLEAPWRDIIEIVLDTGKPRKEELRCGDTFFSLVFHPSGDGCVNVYGADITGIKHAQEKIEQLSRISTEDTNLLLRVSGDGTILYDNKVGFSMLGDWHYRDGPLLIDYWHQFVLKALGSGMSQQMEAKFGDSYCSFTFTPIIDSNYVNVYLFDITQDKLAAERDRSVIEKKEIEEAQKTNSINEIVKEVYNKKLGIAKDKGLNLAIELDSEIPRIIFDREKISLALENLLAYAFDSTGSGSVKISTCQEGDNIIRVSVKDSGDGVKAEDLPRLFYLFEEEGVSPEDSRISAGLAVAKNIVENHNGKMWAESRIGKGTIFHFILPIRERRKVTGQSLSGKEKRT